MRYPEIDTARKDDKNETKKETIAWTALHKNGKNPGTHLRLQYCQKSSLSEDRRPVQVVEMNILATLQLEYNKK